MPAESWSQQIDRVAAECIAVRLRLLNRVVTNIYDEALRPFDVKVSQLNVLVAAAKLGVARPADVCRYLHLDESTLSRNVLRMKARGWLETVADDDGRTQPFRLTAAGKQLLRQTMPAWDQAQQQVEQVLGSALVTQIGRTVHQLPPS